MVKETPPKDNMEKFQKGIWGKEKPYNMSARWIENTEIENRKVNEQEWESITVFELKAALTKSQKWKSPGIANVQIFWLNALLSSHVMFTSLLNEIMQNPEKSPEWMCEGTTY